MKVSHHQAQYGAGTEEKHCAICVMYRPGPHCTKVEDPIEPYAHCKYFSPEKSHAARR